jgi:hypothetical protein
MEEKSPAKKARTTLKNKRPGLKAAFAKRRKKAAAEAAAREQANQWQAEMVEYLGGLNSNTVPNTCLICGENKSFLLQNHPLDSEGKTFVQLCPKCHSTVNRCSVKELKEAHP